MKRIKLKSSVVIRGMPNVKVGEPVDVADSEAQVLLGMGVAELVGPEEKPDGLTTGRGAIETPTPVLQARDPQLGAEKPPGKSSKHKPAS